MNTVKIYSTDGLNYIEVTQEQYQSILATAEIMADEELMIELRDSLNNKNVLDREFISIEELKKLWEI